VSVGTQIPALSPPHRGHELDAQVGQVRALLARGELDIRAGPLGGPHVLVVESVECRTAGPVVPGQLEGVLDAENALFGAIDQEESAERPEGLTAQVGRVLLVDHRDFLAPSGQFVGGDQSGQTRTDHDDVSIHATASYSHTAYPMR
jgi:hypothetical protein